MSLNLHISRSGGLTISQRNVLVDGDGVACISGFGLEIVLHDEVPSKSIPINVRWIAPEVLYAEDGRIPSGDGGKAADMYSFAMVMFEVSIPTFTREFETASHPSPQVLSGTTPFPNKSDEEILNRVFAGLRPKWPSDSSEWLEDELSEQIEACWSQEPNERPAAYEVLQTLLALSDAQHRETVESVESSDDEAVTRERDDPEESAFLARL